MNGWEVLLDLHHDVWKHGYLGRSGKERWESWWVGMLWKRYQGFETSLLQRKLYCRGEYRYGNKLRATLISSRIKDFHVEYWHVVFAWLSRRLGHYWHIIRAYMYAGHVVRSKLYIKNPNLSLPYVDTTGNTHELMVTYTTNKDALAKFIVTPGMSGHNNNNTPFFRSRSLSRRTLCFA